MSLSHAPTHVLATSSLTMTTLFSYFDKVPRKCSPSATSGGCDENDTGVTPKRRRVSRISYVKRMLMMPIRSVVLKKRCIIESDESGEDSLSVDIPEITPNADIPNVDAPNMDSRNGECVYHAHFIVNCFYKCRYTYGVAKGCGSCQYVSRVHIIEKKAMCFRVPF